MNLQTDRHLVPVSISDMPLPWRKRDVAKTLSSPWLLATLWEEKSRGSIQLMLGVGMWSTESHSFQRWLWSATSSFSSNATTDPALLSAALFFQEKATNGKNKINVATVWKGSDHLFFLSYSMFLMPSPCFHQMPTTVYKLLGSRKIESIVSEA